MFLQGVEDALDEVERAKYARYLPLPLASLPAAVSSGTVLDVEDTTQSLHVRIKVALHE